MLDKVVFLNAKNATFRIHSKCLKKMSDELYKQSELTDNVWLEKFDKRVVKIALKFALNPKKYENQLLSRDLRFNVIKFAAKFNFPTKITEKMLNPGIYVKLIEYAEDTLNEYLMDLLPKAFDKFPEVERYPEFLKINERKRNKFLAARDANRKKVAKVNSVMEKTQSAIIIIVILLSYYPSDTFLGRFLR
uniref:BTB domain-containing protein n=1 Tax=Panagrellus redivivus TaxID=6233 RepID=A0A7E4VVD6_PANRE